jgi:uncharacterized membrane protein HdeD (DUF308 family)
MTDIAQPWPDVQTELRNQPVPWWTLLITGLFSVALGLTVLIWPDISLRVMAWLTGIWLVLGGLARIVAAFMPTGASIGRHLLSGVIGIIVLIGGLICLRNLVTSLAVLAVLFATTWILSGVALILSAVGTEGGLRATLLFGGVIAMLAGTMLVVTPQLSLATLILLTGVGSLVVGLAELIMAFVVRRLKS